MMLVPAIDAVPAHLVEASIGPASLTSDNRTLIPIVRRLHLDHSAHVKSAGAPAGGRAADGQAPQRHREVTAIDWPDGPYTHEGSRMGYLPWQVSLAELDRHVDRPLISASVVERVSGRPSNGFRTFCRELGSGRCEVSRARSSIKVRHYSRYPCGAAACHS